MKEKIRTYSELVQFDSFIDRFRYLKLSGVIGDATFGFDRYLNQMFYRTPEWKSIRREILIRDNGCDLGCEDRPIPNRSRTIIHHLNPISMDDIVNHRDWILDPEYLILTTFETHNAIHYGDESLLFLGPTVRTPNDTCPWLPGGINE